MGKAGRTAFLAVVHICIYPTFQYNGPGIRSLYPLSQIETRRPEVLECRVLQQSLRELNTAKSWLTCSIKQRENNANTLSTLVAQFARLSFQRAESLSREIFETLTTDNEFPWGIFHNRF